MMADAPAAAVKADDGPAGRRPSVLHVLAPTDFGGAERVVHALARGLRRRGQTVGVLLIVDPGKSDHPLRHSLDDAGVPAWCAEVAPRAYRDEQRQLADVARRTRTMVVHTHGARADVVDGTAARRLGLRTISTLHGFSGGSLKNRAYEWLQRRWVRACDAVVAVSAPIANRMRALGVPSQRLRVIRNAWIPVEGQLDRHAAREVLGIPPGEFVAGWVGRFSPTKGADVLVAAMTMLDGPSISASIVGDGPMGPELRERAAQSCVGHRIRWHGAIPDAGRLVRAFDVFVLSSRTEGTPIALLEAVGAGIPVVATAVGGVPDVVGPAEAILVPPDDPSALADGIRRVFSEREGAAARAAAGRARIARELAEEPWLDQYQDVYQAVCRQQPGRR